MENREYNPQYNKNIIFSPTNNGRKYNLYVI